MKDYATWCYEFEEAYVKSGTKAPLDDDLMNELYEEGFDVETALDEYFDRLWK